MIQDTPDVLKNKLGLGSYDYNVPSTFVPKISKQDYDASYITRYFVGKRNFFDVIETDAKGYKLADSNFYTKVVIDWKISGPEFSLYQGKTLQTTGVVEYNNRRIKQASLIIKGIETVLNNPRQFWRGY